MIMQFQAIQNENGEVIKEIGIILYILEMLLQNKLPQLEGDKVSVWAI